MTVVADRLTPALEWILRLPLLGDRELGRLLGIHEREAHRLRLELERGGWIESVVPRAEGLEERRLAFIREESVPSVAKALSIPTDELVRHFPVRRRDVLPRFTSVEISAWVNRFAAELAASRGLPAVLTDARSLPLATTAHDRWWLPRTCAYGCLRSGRQYAPFLLAWDRHAAPDQHRRQCVSAWYGGAKTRVTSIWRSGGAPTLLVVAAGDDELAFWERLLVRAAERSGDRPVEVLLATVRQVAEIGPAGAIWREPGSGVRGLLVERLGWGGEPPIQNWRLCRDLAETEVPRTAPPLRVWASRAAVDPATPMDDRVGAVGITIDREQRRLIEWIGRHPLLSISELAAVLHESTVVLARRLDELVRCGVIRTMSLGASTDEGRRPPDDQHEQRYVLTELGLRFLAAQAGARTVTFERLGGVTVAAGDEPDSGARPLRHPEHTLGVNRFVARLATDARRLGWRLAEWRNEAESTHRFAKADGGTSWIRPDGSGVLVRGRGSAPFLLEYDRGTLDAGDYRPKLEAYARYFDQREWEHAFPGEPALLFVCGDDRAEERVRGAVAEAGGLPRVLMTAEWRFERGGNRLGALGDVWLQMNAQNGPRCGWPLAGFGEVSLAATK